MGPPLPRAPYVDRRYPAGPMVGPTAGPGGDYAVLDWGAGSGSDYGSEYGYGSDYGTGVGGIPPFETK